MGIHLFIDKEDHRGHQYKDYTIYSDPLVTAWQCRRECVRHRGLNIDQDIDRRQAVRALGDRSALARASARFRVACDIRCVS